MNSNHCVFVYTVTKTPKLFSCCCVVSLITAPSVTQLIKHGALICKRSAPLKVVFSHSFPFSFLSFFSKLIFISHTENNLYIEWTKRHIIGQTKIYRGEMFEDTVVPGRPIKAFYILFRQITGLYLTKGNVSAL